MAELEIYYEIVSEIRFWLLLIMTGFCYYYLVKGFIKKNPYAWLVGAAYVLTMAVLWYMPFYIDNYIAYGLGAFAGFFVMWRLDKENLKQKIFLSVMFYSLRDFTIAMAQCIENGLIKASYHIPDYDGNGSVQFVVYTGISCVDLLVSFGFMFFAVWLIQKAYVFKRAGMTGKELALLIMPVLSVIAGRKTLQYLEMLYAQDTGKNSFDLVSAYDGRRFIFYGISFGAVLVMIVMFQKIKAQQEKERQEELLAGQAEEMKRHIEQVEKLYGDIRSLKHDMSNHVMILENLYLRREHEEAGEYVLRLKEKISEVLPEIRSGNPITDVILTEKQKEAEEKGVEFFSTFYYPAGSKVNAFDISVILNNALTNALAAAAECRHPHVKITSYQKRNAYMIEIQNSYVHKITIDEESGLPVTTKADGHSHGFGLANIRKVAREYCGDMDIAYDGETFSLHVMLMLAP